jgi:hypothetical protein
MRTDGTRAHLGHEVPLEIVEARHVNQITESPIFDAPFWSENGISCPYERNKIGDSVL